jgi:hypothetical protein
MWLNTKCCLKSIRIIPLVAPKVLYDYRTIYIAPRNNLESTPRQASLAPNHVPIPMI